ncbi:MAG: membrane protein insertion efficiency factor YidD [Cyanobacteria bacterium SBLK]|nr:membrane protein insertion efficiency factor YidD [Cyanobacteria bacterium SBLK]
MNTLHSPRRWHYFIFRGLVRTVRNPLYFLLNFILVALEQLSRTRIPILAKTARMIEKSAKKTGVELIRSYQKFLSPYKGFSCAHRTLYGGESCSQYVKKTLLEQDLRSAIALSRQRFTDCKTAKIILRSEELEQKKKKRKQSHPNNSSDGCIDFADCSCSLLEFGGGENCNNPFSDCGNTGDCGGNFDCTPDCGNCDCSGCDCG